jgi:hypothetical protein
MCRSEAIKFRLSPSNIMGGFEVPHYNGCPTKTNAGTHTCIFQYEVISVFSITYCTRMTRGRPELSGVLVIFL